MNKLSSGALIFGIIVVSFLPKTTQAQQATLQYRQLLKLAQGTKKNDTSVKSYTAKIVSKNKVPASEIEMFLNTKKGRKLIFANKNGEIQVPNSTALYSENPFFITNQPKGSLEITAIITTPPFVAPKVVDGKIAYQDLFKPILDSTKEMQKLDPTFGKEGQMEFVLIIKTNQPIKFVRSMNDSGQKIVGTRTYKPHDGFIVLAFDEMINNTNGNSIVEIPGTATFSHDMADPQLAKRIRQSFYSDPEDKNPIIIKGTKTE